MNLIFAPERNDRTTEFESIVQCQRDYWNTLARNIDDDIAANHWVTEENLPVSSALFSEIAEFLVGEFLGQRAGANVLEVGCGNGLILDQLGSQWNLFGADVSSEMLSRAVVKVATLYCCDATSIPCEDRSFDLIYMHSVVQYFGSDEYLDRVMAECCRLLKPGGSLCLMDVPIRWYQHLMSSPPSWRSKLKQGVKWAIGFLPVRMQQAARRPRRVQEQICGRTVCVPAVRGFYADPDYFRKFESQFAKISIELQPFPHKPTIYKKFRFNIILRNRRETVPASSETARQSRDA